jgi:hypothetical protein
METSAKRILDPIREIAEKNGIAFEGVFVKDRYPADGSLRRWPRRKPAISLSWLLTADAGSLNFLWAAKRLMSWPTVQFPCLCVDSDVKLSTP